MTISESIALSSSHVETHFSAFFCFLFNGLNKNSYFLFNELNKKVYFCLWEIDFCCVKKTT